MVKWEIDLTNFNQVSFDNINQIIYPNYDDLNREICAFNEEIVWDKMWTINDAKDRLAAGWIFVGLFIDHKIKGWVWLNTSNNLLCNLYVNKEYRNLGNAKKLVLKLNSIAKELNIEKLYSETDVWNEHSKSVFLRTGYTLQKL
jgi:GNAT superfamily N-acetyltransferase